MHISVSHFIELDIVISHHHRWIYSVCIVSNTSCKTLAPFAHRKFMSRPQFQTNKKHNFNCARTHTHTRKSNKFLLCLAKTMIDVLDIRTLCCGKYNKKEAKTRRRKRSLFPNRSTKTMYIVQFLSYILFIRRSVPHFSHWSLRKKAHPRRNGTRRAFSASPTWGECIVRCTVWVYQIFKVNEL